MAQASEFRALPAPPSTGGDTTLRSWIIRHRSARTAGQSPGGPASKATKLVSRDGAPHSTSPLAQGRPHPAGLRLTARQSSWGPDVAASQGMGPARCHPPPIWWME